MYKLYIEKDVSSRKLLKKVLTTLNIHDNLVYNEYGKPYLKRNEIYFNISHAKPYTVLVISNKEIGVDIEKITMKDKVMKKVCTEEEKKLIKTADDFTVIWVKKESYVKYIGVGLSYGLKNVDTLKINNFIIKKFKDYYIAIYGDDLEEEEK